MSDHVEQIKDRLGIADVVGSYIPLERAGRNLKARCPFHNERTPSFVVSPDRGTFYCFGCGKKGDIFSFVQEYENLDFMGALKLLADKAGVTVTLGRSETNQHKKEGLQVLEKVTAFYQEQLKGHAAAKAYLTKRGVTDSTIEKWRIGAAPDTWRAAHDHLLAQGIGKEVLVRTGIIKQGDTGDYYDRFRNRVMFPIADATGNVVGFTGRILVPDEKSAKYVNSPETEYFNKSKLLFGYHLAKQSIRKHNFSILVEGQFDAIMAHQMGYTNTVATSGTALTDDQLTLLARASSRLVIALDADGAGFKASERAWQMALAKGMDVKIARLPQGKDPADMALENPTQWKEAIKQATHIIDFLADQVSVQKLSGRELARALHEMVVPYIVKLESSIEQAHFVERLAGRFGINKDAFWQEVATRAPGAPRVVDSRATQEYQQATQSVLDQLIGIVLWQQTLADATVSVADLVARITSIIGNDVWEVRMRTVDQDALLFASEALYATPELLLRACDELVARLTRATLVERRAQAKQLLVEAEASNDTHRQDELLTEIDTLTKALEQVDH
ncbi:MAG: primase, primase protein [Candidatus Parcubacteria bacterium]|jgi:DNA primase